MPHENLVFFSTKTEIQSSGWKRHCMLWTDDEREKLELFFARSHSLLTICTALERSPAGVLAKLIQYGYLTRRDYGDYSEFHVTNKGEDLIFSSDSTIVKPKPSTEITPNPTFNPFDTEKTEMTTANNTINTVELRTFVNGKDVTGFTDDQIFNMIADTEDEISRMGAISARSVKLGKRIDELDANIKALVKFVDER